MGSIFELGIILATDNLLSVILFSLLSCKANKDSDSLVETVPNSELLALTWEL